MPIIQNQSPFQQLIDNFAALFPVVQQQQNTKFEQQREKQQDVQTQALNAANLARSQEETATGYAAAGLGPTGEALPPVNYQQIPAAPAKGQSPDAFYDSAVRTALSNAATAHTNQRPQDETFWQQQAHAYVDQGYKYTSEQYTNLGKLPEAQATTQEIKAKTHNLQGQFEHDIEMLRQRGANAEQVARIHAAYRRAGGGAASTSAAAQHAMLAAMNEAARAGVSMQNSEMERTYYSQQELHDADPADYPNAPQQPQLQPYPVYLPPAQPGGRPTVIYVGGQQQQKAPAQTESTLGPSPQQAGPTLGGMVQGVEHFFGLGGGSQRLTAKDKTTGKPIHSDDGGKTWQPGP